MEEIQICIEKMAIKELLSRYAICVDTGDAEGFAKVFTEDAVWEWESAGLVFEGRKQLHDLAMAIREYVPGAQHLVINHVIDVTGSTARATSQFTVLLSRPEQIYPLMIGIYRDDIIKVDGSWHIQKRQVHVNNPEILSAGKIGEYYRPFVEHLTGAKDKGARP